MPFIDFPLGKRNSPTTLNPDYAIVYTGIYYTWSSAMLYMYYMMLCERVLREKVHYNIAYTQIKWIIRNIRTTHTSDYIIIITIVVVRRNRRVDF